MGMAHTNLDRFFKKDSMLRPMMDLREMKVTYEHNGGWISEWRNVQEYQLEGCR